MQTIKRRRADMLAEAARRFEAHYGDRLLELYALAKDPYESEASEAVHLVLVLKDLEPFAESRAMAKIAGKLIDEYGVDLVAHNTVPGDELAQAVRKEGVRL